MSQNEQSKLDDALDDSFPASDPPSMTDPSHGTGRAKPLLDEDAVRERAYQIWQAAGSPHGGHDAHWAQARDELEAAASGGGA